MATTTKRKKRPTKLQLECSRLTIEGSELRDECTDLRQQINEANQRTAQAARLAGKTVHVAVVVEGRDQFRLAVFSQPDFARSAVQPAITAGHIVSVKPAVIDG